MKSQSLLAACLLICTTGLVSAQNYPSKPIRYIVPFPPGGGTDIVARALAPRLLEASGITLIVDNRGGGGTVVGAEMAARSPADGYTVFMGTNTSHAINPNLPTKLPYDAVRDFQPVTRLALVPYMITVHPSLPVRNVKELVALAKARPGQLNFASSGNGTPWWRARAASTRPHCWRAREAGSKLSSTVSNSSGERSACGAPSAATRRRRRR